MSSAIMTLLISHILTFVESELVKEEPELVAHLTQDVQSLIAKLEALIEGKSQAVAAVVNHNIMRLTKGAKPGSAGFKRNIKAEVTAGKPIKQAVAIAYSESTEKKRKPKGRK